MDAGCWSALAMTAIAPKASARIARHIVTLSSCVVSGEGLEEERKMEQTMQRSQYCLFPFSADTDLSAHYRIVRPWQRCAIIIG